MKYVFKHIFLSIVQFNLMITLFLSIILFNLSGDHYDLSSINSLLVQTPRCTTVSKTLLLLLVTFR